MFNLIVEQCFRIVWSVERKLRVKIQGLQRKENPMFLSKCAVSGSRKWIFIKEQEASGLLSSLGLKISILSKFPIAVDIYFKAIKWMK